MAEEATTTLSHQSKEQHRDRNEVRSGQLCDGPCGLGAKQSTSRTLSKSKGGIEAILQGKKRKQKSHRDL